MRIFEAIGLLPLSDLRLGDLQQWVIGGWTGTIQFIQEWRQTLDPIVWLVGSLLALVPGSFAIHKWWNYKNSRMPKRLDELLTKEDTRLKGVRAALLRTVNQPNAAVVSVGRPLFVVPAVAKIIISSNWSQWWKPKPLSAAEPELEQALVELEGRMHFCSRSQALCQEQEATVFLLKGAIAAARAGNAEPTSVESLNQNRIALNHFSRALEINPNDFEALEYVAHQHRALQNYDLAKASYERLASLATASNSETRSIRSRAYRFLAEMLEKHFEKSGVWARLIDADDSLREALDCLPTEDRGSLSHAAIYEVLGRVKRAQGAIQLPGTHFSSALSIYADVLVRDPSNIDAKAGVERMNVDLS